MARVSKQPEERRQELIEAAQALFLSQGYERTAVNDIVKQVGVAQGLFYYYFKSKKDIFIAVIDQYIGMRIGELAVELCDERVPPLGRIGNVIATLSHFLNEMEVMYPEGKEGATLEMHSMMQNHVMAVMEPMAAKVLKEGIEGGVIQTPYPEQMARFFIAGFIGVATMNQRPQAKELMAIIYYTVESLLGVTKKTLESGRDET